MPATHKRAPIGTLDLTILGECLIRTELVRRLYGHVGRRRHGSEGGIAPALRVGPAVKTSASVTGAWISPERPRTDACRPASRASRSVNDVDKPGVRETILPPLLQEAGDVESLIPFRETIPSRQPDDVGGSIFRMLGAHQRPADNSAAARS
jgi:hypothetical protein